MAIFVQPTLPVSFTVAGNVQSAPAAIQVNQCRPSMPLAFGPIAAPDIDGRYLPPTLLLVV